MPRSKPTQVIEIRHSLSTWERDRIKRAELVAASAVIMPAIGIGILGIGGGLAGFALYQWLSDSPFHDLFNFNELPPIQWYDPAKDPTGENRGFWSMTWDSLTESVFSLGGII